MDNLGQFELFSKQASFEQTTNPTATLLHSPTSWIGLICFPLDPDLDFLALRLPRRLFSLFAFSSAISWRINAPVSTTTCTSGIMAADDGDRLELGVARGVHSASSNTQGKRRSSSEMYELTGP